MRGDGKNNFYRTLKLDKKIKQVMRDFNKIKQDMINDIENDDEEE
jgi:hypothetical protein